jgi:hypothetical protein
MEAAAEFAGLAVVALISILLALSLGWLSLWALMRLMPPREPALANGRAIPIHARRFRLRAATH